MKTLAPASQPELWAETVDLDQLDLTEPLPLRGGLVVTVAVLDDTVLDRLFTVLAYGRLDRVVVDAPVDRFAACAALALLRDCKGHDIDVVLDIAPEEAWFDGVAAHLAPREAGAPLRFDLYRRHGPGFVQVVDDRPGHNVRITFSDGDDIALLNALDRPMPVAVLDAERLQAFTELDLAVVVDDVAVSIVPRIKRWPVPHDDLFAPPTA